MACAAAGDAGRCRVMPSHPLDPLTAEEIRLTVAIDGREQRWRFASIELREPSKAVISDFAPGTAFARSARVVCWNRDDGKVYTAAVSLTEDRVTSWRRQHPGRGACDGHHGDHPPARRRPSTPRDDRRRANLRAVFISISSSHGWIWTSTGRQHRPRDRLRGPAHRARQPKWPGARPAQHAAADRAGRQAGL